MKSHEIKIRIAEITKKIKANKKEMDVLRQEMVIRLRICEALKNMLEHEPKSYELRTRPSLTINPLPRCAKAAMGQ